MIKSYNKFLKESLEIKNGKQDLFPSAPYKQTINRSNPTMDFLRVGKHILTKKIDGFIDSVQNESIFITDRMTGEIRKYTLKEVLREMTQGKEKGSSTVQGFEGTPAWAVKQKIYEDYEPKRQFEPDESETEVEEEQELEYGDEEEEINIDYGDEEENDDTDNDQADHEPAPNSRAYRDMLLYGTEDNPMGLPGKGIRAEKKQFESFDYEEVEEEVPVRGTEDNPLPERRRRRKPKVERYD